MAHTERITGGCSDFSIIIHPNRNSRAIVVNVPGYRGDIHGYNGKYDTIGAHVSEHVAFVQMPNIEHSTDPCTYCNCLNDDIQRVCDFLRTSGQLWCAVESPHLYLAGISAGGAAVAAVAHEVDAKKVLLIEPSKQLALWNRIEAGLPKYSGVMRIVVGGGPGAIGVSVGRRFYDLATAASIKEIETIPDCDHQFRGTKNGQILSKAYTWAFIGDTTFPSPEGGLILY